MPLTPTLAAGVIIIDLFSKIKIKIQASRSSGYRQYLLHVCTVRYAY
jgi:hypothetical protein